MTALFAGGPLARLCALLLRAGCYTRPMIALSGQASWDHAPTFREWEAVWGVNPYPGGTFLMNAGIAYLSSLVGPSNSDPGWVWQLFDGVALDDVTLLAARVVDGAIIQLWRYYDEEAGRHVWISTRRIGYVYHLREGKFLWLE